MLNFYVPEYFSVFLYVNIANYMYVINHGFLLHGTLLQLISYHLF